MTDIISVYEARKLCSLAWDRSLEFFTFFHRGKNFQFQEGVTIHNGCFTFLKEKECFPFERTFNCNRISCASSDLPWQVEQVRSND